MLAKCHMKQERTTAAVSRRVIVPRLQARRQQAQFTVCLTSTGIKQSMLTR